MKKLRLSDTTLFYRVVQDFPEGGFRRIIAMTHLKCDALLILDAWKEQKDESTHEYVERYNPNTNIWRKI